jgi:hypothetical protein
MIIRKLDTIDALCFALTSKHNYDLVMYKHREAILQLTKRDTPLFTSNLQNPKDGAWLSVDGQSRLEQVVSRLWDWFGQRCVYCGYHERALSRLKGKTWVYTGHPCHFGMQYWRAGSDLQIALFNEQICAFDIDNWISKRHRSNHAAIILKRLFLEYRGLLIEVKRKLEGPSRIDVADLRPYIQLFIAMLNKWDGWTRVGRQIYPSCFKAGLVAKSLYELRRLFAGYGCICSCYGELGRPYSITVTCCHPPKSRSLRYHCRG